MSVYHSCYTECRKCFWPMTGILSVAAREYCHACGGKALNVWGDRDNLGRHKKRKSKSMPPRTPPKRGRAA